EMVPHAGVEEAVAKALGLGDSEVPAIAVGSRVDSAKGEALVLLSTVDIDAADLRRRLTEAGLANLWIPRHIVRVESIPVLGTGKLDLGKINKIAKGAAF
ncbi:MAG: AMP-dependent synthetase, partial [Opitutales bacterium]|nr:AMP-dependent synthetase [Opitutales bacterium]